MERKDDVQAAGQAARRATRANRRLEHEWVVIPALVIAVFVIAFGAKVLFG